MQFVEVKPTDRICKSFKSDCVVRAISLALRLPYNQVFRELMILGLEVGAYPNHEKVWQRYVESKGWVKHKPPRNESGKLIKLRDWQNGPKDAVVINSRHLTAIVGGEIHDTWDCTYRPVNSYWAKR